VSARWGFNLFEKFSELGLKALFMDWAWGKGQV